MPADYPALAALITAWQQTAALQAQQGAILQALLRRTHTLVAAIAGMALSHVASSPTNDEPPSAAANPSTTTIMPQPRVPTNITNPKNGSNSAAGSTSTHAGTASSPSARPSSLTGEVLPTSTPSANTSMPAAFTSRSPWTVPPGHDECAAAVPPSTDDVPMDNDPETNT